MEDNKKKLIFALVTIAILVISSSLIFSLFKTEDIVIEDYVDIPSEQDLRNQALLQDLTNKFEGLDDQIEAEKKKLEDLENQEIKDDEKSPTQLLTTVNTKCEDEVDNIEDDVNDLKDDLDDEEDDEENVRAELFALEEELKAAIARGASQFEQDQIVDDIKDLERDLDDEEDDVNRVRRELNDARVRLNDARARCNAEKSQEAFKIIQEANFDKNICESVIDGFKDFIEDLDNDKDDSEDDVNREEEDLKISEDFLAKVLNNTNSTQSQIQRARNEVEDKEDDVKDAEDDVEDIKDRISDARDQLKEIRSRCGVR